jgi:[citrate (pro-3S)-lyase] ligase
MNDKEIRIVNLASEREVTAIRNFLANFGLSFDGGVDYTLAAYRGDEVIGTGSFAGKVLCNFAVCEDVRGEGLTAAIASQLMAEQGRRGTYHYFVYTRPASAAMFIGLGFKEIARAEPYAVLLEYGLGSIDAYCREVTSLAAHLPLSRRAALVVNCNPFTLGHRAVIEEAARANDAVIVFVVAEDRSLFPFADRIELVRAGVADLADVVVVSGGDYIISAATFPAYFTRGEETVAAQTRLDASLFAARIAPALGISRRYVGEEPYCAVTAAYNQALDAILPGHGVAVKVVPRRQAGGIVISASTVRELIRKDDWDGIKALVPDSTYAYLRSEKARPVLAKIHQSASRH